MSTAPANRAELDVDRKVYATFFAGFQASGIFVDVGAARPDFLSVSAFFREQGWRVLCIEPNPEFAQLHRDRGHEIYQYACGPDESDEVEFCVADSDGQNYEGGQVSFESFSSLSLKPGYKALLPDSVKLKSIKVQVRRLDSILNEAGVTKIDVLSADVEGWELEVLASIDLARANPSVIIIENFLKDAAYESRLRELGYVLWKNLFPNQVYIRPALITRLSLWERARLHLREKFGRAPVR